MDPAVPAIVLAARHLPEDARGDAAAFGQGGGEFVAHAGRAADFVHEGRLQDAGHAQRGAGEEDAEGGGGAHEEVLDW